MKAALAMGLGALMAVGTAAPAAAASHIDFSGYYRIMYMNETNTSHSTDSRSFTDSYFQDRLNLDLTFSPTDEISVYWRLRGPGSAQRWGRSNSADKNLYTQFIYGEIKQDWGTVLIGRLSDDFDCAGLCTFGYMPATIPVFTNNGVFDRADIMDGIRYSYGWDNGFSIMAKYGKLGNNGQAPGSIDSGSVNGASDQDYDRYQVEGAYAWDGGGASLHVYYDRNAMPNGDLAGGLNKVQTWGVNPSIMHTFGDFSVHFEGMANWATSKYVGNYDQDGEGYGAYLDGDYNYGPGNVTLAAWWVSGTGLGEDPADIRSKNKSITDLVGGNFYPLLVAYNGANNNPGGNRYYGKKSDNGTSVIGFANNGYENYVKSGYENASFLNQADFVAASYALGHTKATLIASQSRVRTTSFNEGTDANHWAIALTGNHAFTDDISMHYGLAYLALNKPNYRIAQSASYAGLNSGGTTSITGASYISQDKDLGFEIDLGFTFQLLDNLSFTTAVGYMFNGDAYREMKGYRWTNTSPAATPGTTGRMDAVWKDADDSYVWFNSLTFAF